VSERLADALRSEAPATYTPEQICAVIAMTCEKPSESERPISHWSQPGIADEAIRRGLVAAQSWAGFADVRAVVREMDSAMMA
jgi:putative transposase